MRLTKFGHSCVLVEAEERGKPRVALFDPGGWSELPLDTIDWIDDVFISHIHGDHCDPEKLRQIVNKFPDLRITAPTEVVAMLQQQGFTHARLAGKQKKAAMLMNTFQQLAIRI